VLAVGAHPGLGELRRAVRHGGGDTGSLPGDLGYAVGAISNALTGGLSLIGLIEAVREDAILRDLVREQIERRTVADGLLIARRAAERGEDVDAGRVSRALGVAVAQLFLETLLNGGRPGAETRQRLVDDVLMPLLAAPPDRQRPV
jgi:hypothetical protein